MTLHAAKGLEFPVVFVVALEDEMLPHARSKEDPDQVEEERRLLFVGMTRAEEELHLSAVQQRTLRGEVKNRATSPFLMELPREEMEVIGPLGLGGFDYTDYAPADDWRDDAPEDELWDAVDDLDIDGADMEDRVEDVGSVDEVADRRVDEEDAGGAARPGPKFVTAAEFAGATEDAPAILPEVFRHGMVVIHPEYGLGKIVELEGRGARRSASVQFSDAIGTRSFRLSFSPLKPVGS